MAVMAELHAAIYIEPGPDADCCREDECQEEEKKILFWEERKDRSIELEQQQRFLKERCSRVAEELRIKEEKILLTPDRRRLRRRLERLLKDFPRDGVVQELRRIGLITGSQ